MKNIGSLQIGMLLKNDAENINWRIISFIDEGCEICDLNAADLQIFYMPRKMILDQINSGEILPITAPAPIVFNRDELSEGAAEIYNRNSTIVNRISSVYGSDFLDLSGRRSKQIYDEIATELHVSQKTVRKVVKKWIQSGRQNTALLDQRTIKQFSSSKRRYQYQAAPGRRTITGVPAKILSDDDYKNMDRALSAYLRSEVSTIEDAYKDMLLKNYTIEKWTGEFYELYPLPPGERPSIDQFRRYKKQTITHEQEKRAKMGADRFRSDGRLLTGTANDNVQGPGDCLEIDAHEVDLSDVSCADPTICVGRAVIYMAIDVYTRMILGIEISYNNNDFLAITSMFANFAEDKEKLLAKYGISTAQYENYSIDDIWPSNITPTRIRVDHGSDFICNEFWRILRELNITSDTVAVATGSWKSIVERMFGKIERKIKPLFEGHGLIDPEHRSSHHENSAANIDDVSKILLLCLIEHNMHHMRTYPKTPDMAKKGMDVVSPAALWQYGCRKYGTPRLLPNGLNYMYVLMREETAYYDRRGIHFMTLSYVDNEDRELLNEMMATHDRRKNITIRIDPRSMAAVYYLRNGQVRTASLNNRNAGDREFAKFTMKEMQTYLDDKKVSDAKARESNLQADLWLKQGMESIAKDAIKRSSEASPGKSETKNMRENRNAEKQKVSAESALLGRLVEDCGEVSVPDFADTDDALQTAGSSSEQEKIPENLSDEDIRKRIMDNSRKMSEKNKH